VTYSLGDRVRWSTTGEDGLPLVRYGFVGGVVGETGPVVVMLDGELNGDVVAIDQLEPVSITSIELRLDGVDLVSDPHLRQGLVHLWQAEAESAGLDVDSVHCMGAGYANYPGSWSLADLWSGGRQYVVRALLSTSEPDVVRVHAVSPNGDDPLER
jgi:hypothetical protein